MAVKLTRKGWTLVVVSFILWLVLVAMTWDLVIEIISALSLYATAHALIYERTDVEK